MFTRTTSFLLLAPGLAAAGISWLLTPWVAKLAFRIGAVDRPGPRKIHRTPIARLGGLAVVIASFTLWLLLYLFPVPPLQWLPDELAYGMLFGVLPILAVSFRDDVRPVSVTWKLAMQALGALIAVACGVRLNSEVHLFGHAIWLGRLAGPISFAWIVGVTNAFNLADGLDGLSAGLALISSMGIAAVALVAQGGTAVAVPLVLVGALIGFLPYNIYPARIFLGDVGATSIGFCLACLGLRGGATLSAGMAVLVPVVVTGVPIADTVLCIVRRLGRGITQPDGNHVHHRLLAMGVSHRTSVFLLYGVGLAMAIVGVSSLFVTASNAALLLVALLLCGFIGIGRLGYDEFALIRKGVLLRFYDAPVLRLSLFPVFCDLGLIILSLYTAIGIKYDDWRVLAHRQLAVRLLAILPVITITAFGIGRMYRRSWHHSSLEDLTRSSFVFIVACASAFLVSRIVIGTQVTASLFVLYTLILLLLLNATKSSFRVLSYLSQRTNLNGIPVIIYGAGAAGALVVRELLSNPDLGFIPVGFIDDDPRKVGRTMNGLSVLGSSQSLDRLLSGSFARGVIVASSKIPRQSIIDARQICRRHDIGLMRFRLDLVPLDTPDEDAVSPDRHVFPSRSA